MTQNMREGAEPRRDWLDFVLAWVTPILFPILGFGVLAYFIQYIVDLVKRQPVTSPLELAAVSATIGGLLLVGAFYNERTEQTQLGRDLRVTAKWLLASAVSFTIVFIAIQGVAIITSPSLNWAEWVVVYAAAIAMALAGLTLTTGIVLLLQVLRHI